MFIEVLLCLSVFFCIVGIFSSAKYVFSEIRIPHRRPGKIVLGVNGGTECIEVTVRRLVKKFPDAELLIAAAKTDDESVKIIRKLCEDFDCVKYTDLYPRDDCEL